MEKATIYKGVSYSIPKNSDGVWMWIITLLGASANLWCRVIRSRYMPRVLRLSQPSNARLTLMLFEYLKSS